jgi:hypothetical protein
MPSSDGNVWVLGDLSQAEVRVVAWAGPVPGLKRLFQAGHDIHTAVAQQIARLVQEHDVHLPSGLFRGKHWTTYGPGDPERQIAKTSVHALNYGMGIDKFGRVTGLPVKHARQLQDLYFTLFPEVRSAYQAKIRHTLRTTRTITLPPPFGWKRRFYDLASTEQDRTAFAFLPQSTIGRLLIEIWTRVTAGPLEGRYTPDAIRTRGLDARLQNHDEIGVVCAPTDVSTVIARLTEASRIPLVFGPGPDDLLIVPMDFRVGRTWGDARAVR